MITMIFTDLVNSTAIKSRLPGNDITERNLVYLETILAPHRQQVKAELEKFGGRVIKTEGDAHFLVFDNPAHAACWAVAVQQSHDSSPITTPFGPLQVKIGIHTGSPLTDPQDPNDYVGGEVDYAARVSNLATGGQIMLSAATAQLVRDANINGVSLHEHGERELKGIGRVPIFELHLRREKMKSLVEKKGSPARQIIEKIKKHPFVTAVIATVIAIGIATIAVGDFLDAVTKIRGFTAQFVPSKSRTGPTTSGGTTPIPERGAGIEWNIFNQEVKELYRAGKYDRAVVVAKKAIEVAEKNVGTDHSDVARSLNDLAELYRTQGQYVQAEPLYKRSLAIWEKALGPDHPNVAVSLENLAVLYRATKREREDRELEQRAARIRAIKR